MFRNSLGYKNYRLLRKMEHGNLTSYETLVFVKAINQKIKIVRFTT
jgi:hypothetical protein